MFTAGALTTLEALINRQIAASTPARAALTRLEGRSFAIAFEGGPRTLLRVHISAAREGIRLAQGAAPANAEVRGSPTSLLRLLAGRAEGAHHQAGVTVAGDALVVQGFEALFGHAKPDVAAELAQVLGELPAYYTQQAARGLWASGQRLLSTLTRSSSEYLVEEGRDVLGPDELDAFHSDVDRLRDDVARLEARIDRLGAPREQRA
ncbi:MAG: SCP2 sterol-binding domain-containing protein [Pseudomonadota bacterium]|jgi:ubiquinone biosynthesis protein UbiJ